MVMDSPFTPRSHRADHCPLNGHLNTDSRFVNNPRCPWGGRISIDMCWLDEGGGGLRCRGHAL